MGRTIARFNSLKRSNASFTLKMANAVQLQFGRKAFLPQLHQRPHERKQHSHRQDYCECEPPLHDNESPPAVGAAAVAAEVGDGDVCVSKTFIISQPPQLSFGIVKGEERGGREARGGGERCEMGTRTAESSSDLAGCRNEFTATGSFARMPQGEEAVKGTS